MNLSHKAREDVSWIKLALGRVKHHAFVSTELNRSVTLDHTIP
jgi:hypothetical protein